MSESVETPESAPSAPQAEGFAPQLADSSNVSIRQLIDAGVHFGHQTNRWNPRMAPYIYGARNGIHIVDLDQTARYLKRALNFLTQSVSRGGQVLFVGTKRQAQDVVIEEAVRAGQFHVTGRWLGGTLTNFRTMKVGIERLRNLTQMEDDGSMNALAKKEALGLRRERDRLEKFVGGIRDMNGVPAAMFVIDPQHEHIAVNEANKLKIPVVALTDTNCDPDLIQYIIPGNDDAIRSIKLVTAAVATACASGQRGRRDYSQQSHRGGESAAAAGPSVEFARTRAAQQAAARDAADAGAAAAAPTEKE